VEGRMKRKKEKTTHRLNREEQLKELEEQKEQMLAVLGGEETKEDVAAGGLFQDAADMRLPADNRR
jgi:hypothetical protein